MPDPRSQPLWRPPVLPFVIASLVAGGLCSTARPDGKVVRPRDYKGSLEERAQEAIIVFRGSDSDGKAEEDLILKIQVAGNVEQFAWVVPFPNEPRTEEADVRLFRELFNYVEAQRTSTRRKGWGLGGKTKSKADEKTGVKVLSRKIVGTYDVAVVKETEAGALNGWLKENGYQPLEDADDVLRFYRAKNYVFACIKVADANLRTGESVDLHPLRFTFKTGGRDGIYFPMKMTGLQSDPFDVNLYVFYRYWLNDDLSKFGYVHRGFHLNYRDWDTPRCVPDGGKSYDDPSGVPLLSPHAARLGTVSAFFKQTYPGERFYLTNIQAQGLRPSDVRRWKDDLWLFPYYRNAAFVPYDARPGGVATGWWPDQRVDAYGNDPDVVTWATIATHPATLIGLGVLALFLAAIAFRWYRRRRGWKPSPPLTSG